MTHVKVDMLYVSAMNCIANNYRLSEYKELVEEIPDYLTEKMRTL